VPTGGTAGQALVKNSSSNYDTSWQTISSSGGTGVANTAKPTSPTLNSTYTSPFADQALATDLVLDWVMTEGSGSTTADLSGNGNSGNLNSCTWTTSSGLDTPCIAVPGTSTVTASNTTVGTFEYTQPWSLFTRVKYSSSSTAQIIAREGAGSPNYFGWCLQVVSGCLMFVVEGNAQAITAQTANSFADGNWHAVVVTYDGSGSYTGVNIWVDGTAQTLTASGTVTSTIVQTGFTLRIGGREQQNSNNWTGTVAQFTLWSRKLQSFEATDLTTWPYALEGGGHGSGTSMANATLQNPGSQTVAATGTLVNWSAASGTCNGVVNNGTSLTVPVAGRYHCVATIVLSITSGSAGWVQLSMGPYQFMATCPLEQENAVNVVGVATMAAGQSVTVTVYAIGSTAINNSNGPDNNTIISVDQIG
jgi:hypothetical protein